MYGKTVTERVMKKRECRISEEEGAFRKVDVKIKKYLKILAENYTTEKKLYTALMN